MGWLLLAWVGPTLLGAQEREVPGVISAARLRADLSVDPATVEVRYRLHTLPSSRILGVQVLPVDGIELDEVDVELDGEDRGSVGFAASPTGLLRSGVALGPPADQEHEVEVVLRYELPSAGPESGPPEVIPVVVAGSGAEDPTPDFFVAEVRLPAGHRVVSAFPSSFRVIPDTVGSVYSASLSVLPAFLRIEASSAGSLVTDSVRVAEWAVLLLLGGLGVIGWRYFVRDLGLERKR